MKRLFRSLIVLATFIWPGRQILAAEYIHLSAPPGATSAVVFAGNNSGPARLVSLDVTGDDSTSVLTIRELWAQIGILTNAASSVTNLYLARGHGLASNDVVVLQHGSMASRLKVYSASTNVVSFTTILGVEATAEADFIWNSGTIITTPIGSTTVRLNGVCLGVGGRGKPLVVEINGSSVAKINSAVATYQ